MTPPVVRPFVAADAVALGAPPALATCPGWTAEWAGRPAWAGGVVPLGHGVGEVWVQVSPAAARTAPRRLARDLRWALAAGARAAGVTTVTAHWPVGTPAVARRFAAWLGFRAGGRCAFDAVGAHTAWRVGA